MMARLTLILEAYLRLVTHDVFMKRHDFAALHLRVKSFPLRDAKNGPDVKETIAASLDIASCFYPKQVLCLQRSTVLVKMLRARGIRAHMVIGAQKLPFKAHAWVEVDGKIVNDRLASREKFLVLEVC